MLVEMFHWSPVDLAEADIDVLLPLILYYPHWKNRAAQQTQEEPIYADQAGWL